MKATAGCWSMPATFLGEVEQIVHQAIIGNCCHEDYIRGPGTQSLQPLIYQQQVGFLRVAVALGSLLRAVQPAGLLHVLTAIITRCLFSMGEKSRKARLRCPFCCHC